MVLRILHITLKLANKSVFPGCVRNSLRIHVSCGRGFGWKDDQAPQEPSFAVYVSIVYSPYIYIYIHAPPPPTGPTYLLQIGPNPLILKTCGVSIYTEEVCCCCIVCSGDSLLSNHREEFINVQDMF